MKKKDTLRPFERQIMEAREIEFLKSLGTKLCVDDCNHCHTSLGACHGRTIEDCETHFENCADECHSECACQDRG